MINKDKTTFELENNSQKEKVTTKKNLKKDIVEYDDLLSLTGGFGRYQLLLFISTAPFFIFAGFAYFGQLFITQVSPNHWCWIPELENLTVIERRTLAIPADDGQFGYSRCYAYDVNWTEVIINGNRPNETWSKIPCQHGWEFNKTEIPYPTIASDLEWVCDKDSYPATAQSMFFFGSVFGGVLFGWIADRFGRLPALVISNLIAFIAGTISTFARNFTEFTICRFVYGISNDNLFIMAYLINIEYVAPKYRAFVANLPFALFYAPILIALPWIALACDHWKIFNLATSIPIGLALLSPFFIPESPRWLLSKKRVDRVVEIISAIAKRNKKVVPTAQIELFKQSMSTEKKQEHANMLDIFKNQLLRRTYICMCVVYVSAALIFDALVRTIEQLKYDFFISFSLISLTEIPSLIISAIILDKLGRRLMIAITMTICCISSILIEFVGGGIPPLICAIVARFMANIGFATTTQWAAEVLPTSVRGTGTALVHIFGFIAIITSPYIAYLEKYISWFPPLFIGCLAGFCAILAQTLPETAGIDLPQTFENAENLVRNQKLFSISCLKKRENGYVGEDNKAFS